MSELSRLRVSERYEVRDDDAPGLEPPANKEQEHDTSLQHNQHRE